MLIGAESVLSRFTGVKVTGADTWSADCPCSGHTTPDRHLSFWVVGEWLKLKCHIRHSEEEIMMQVGLRTADLHLGDTVVIAAPKVQGKEVAAYDYKDETGKVLFQAVRYDPKDFKQRHKDETGKWIYNLQGVRRVIYHMDEVLKASTVYVVEGEKDADNLRLYGLCATTSPMGATHWLPEYSDYLAGKKVIIIPDKDGPGMAHAKQVSESLAGKAKEIKTIVLPGDDIKDVTNWLDGGGDVKDLPSMEQDVKGVEAITTAVATTSKKATKDALLLLAPALIKSGPNSLTLCYGDKGAVSEHQFEIRAERLNESGRGKVEGEISVIGKNGQGKDIPLLVNQSFGFMSSSSKESLQRTMRGRIPDLDWTAIIDTCCWKAIQHVRAGEPEVIRQASKITLTQPSYLLYPFLPRNQPTIIFGKKGSCKTTTAMLIVIHVAAAWHDSPFFSGIARHKTITLWLDWETDQDGWDYDFKRLSDGTTGTETEVIYRRCRGALANQIERIKDLVTQYHVGLVVVDSIAPASGGNIKEAESAIEFHNALRYLNTTTLSIGHPPKGDLQEKSSVTGAGQYEDLARNIWEARYEQGEDEPTGHQILIHTKPYKTGYLKPIGIRYEFSDESIIPNKEDPKEVPKFLEKMTQPVQILHCLDDGPKTTQYLAEQIGKTVEQTGPILSRMKKALQVINKDGFWHKIARGY